MWTFDEGSSAEHLGRTNYVGSAGYAGEAHGWGFLKGVFTNRSQTRFRDIRDGTSHTLLIGEAVGGFDCFSGKRTHAYPWIGVGTLGTGGGLDPPGLCIGTGWWQFSSEHKDVVQFALADGSVHSIATTMDWRQFVLLSSMADGRPASLNGQPETQ